LPEDLHVPWLEQARVREREGERDREREGEKGTGREGEKGTGRERETERGRDRQTDRQTVWTDRQTQTDKQTNRQMDRQTHAQIDRQTQTDRQHCERTEGKRNGGHDRASVLQLCMHAFGRGLELLVVDAVRVLADRQRRHHDTQLQHKNRVDESRRQGGLNCGE
jgi:hypothetical protein